MIDAEQLRCSESRQVRSPQPQPNKVYRQNWKYNQISRESHGLCTRKIRFLKNGVPTTLWVVVRSAIQNSFPHELICLSQHAPFVPVLLFCISSSKWREAKWIGDHCVHYVSRRMLDRPWNGHHANFSGALQDVAVSYMKTMPSENSLSCTS